MWLDSPVAQAHDGAVKRTLEPGEGAEENGADTADPLRRRPPAKTLDWVAASVGRGAEVVSVRRLTEGHSHASHVVTVREASGSAHDLVLRRWARPNWKAEDPDFTPEREAAVLQLLGPVSVSTPTLINLDAHGSVCDVPTLLTDRLPGGPPGQPDDLDAFVQQLAEPLPRIHAAARAPQLIPAYRRYNDNPDSVEPPAWTRKPDLWRRAAALVTGNPPPAARECLIHRDYHPGNTLWSGGRLTGVIDWSDRSWGSPAVDTAHMRWNLAVAYGLDAAERFLECYRDLSSDTVLDQHYWDLVTLLDVLWELNPDDLPPKWDLARLEQYLVTVLESL